MNHFIEKTHIESNLEIETKNMEKICLTFQKKWHFLTNNFQM